MAREVVRPESERLLVEYRDHVRKTGVRKRPDRKNLDAEQLAGFVSELIRYQFALYALQLEKKRIYQRVVACGFDYTAVSLIMKSRMPVIDAAWNRGRLKAQGGSARQYNAMIREVHEELLLGNGGLPIIGDAEAVARLREAAPMLKDSLQILAQKPDDWCEEV